MLKPEIYHLPILSEPDFGVFRAPGPGLGNLLFPIARALVGQAQLGGVFVAPTVRQIKIGTLLRNEPDKRIYGCVFRHRKIRDWGVRMAAMAASSVEEADSICHLQKSPSLLCIRYRGLGNYFHDFSHHHSVVCRYLDENARFKGLLGHSYDIAVHIRLGDFVTTTDIAKSGSVRLPFAWYHDAVAEARRVLGGASKIVLFSDSCGPEVCRFAHQIGAKFDPGRNAITSMKNMASARILVCSRSTFSMWGAFLGGIPAIWDGCFDLEPFFPERPELDMRVAVK